MVSADNLISQILARVGDLAGQRTRGHRHRRREKHLRFLVAHATGEIAIRRADAVDARFVDATERVHRTTEARGATGIFRHLHARWSNCPNKLTVSRRRCPASPARQRYQ